MSLFIENRIKSPSFMVGVVGSIIAYRFLDPVYQPVTSTAHCLIALFGRFLNSIEEAVMPNLSLVISNIPVRQDNSGRYSLNDLHKGS